MGLVRLTQKVGDRVPHLEVSFDGIGETDLAGATVYLTMALPGEEPKIDSAVCDVTADVITYVWQVEDTDTAGTYKCEWVIAYANGEEQTVPASNADAFWVRFIPRIG